MTKTNATQVLYEYPPTRAGREPPPPPDHAVSIPDSISPIFWYLVLSALQ